MLASNIIYKLKEVFTSKVKTDLFKEKLGSDFYHI